MEAIKRLNKRLKTFLTVVSLAALSGCSCLPKTPDIKPKQIIQRLGVCKQYTMDFGDKLTFKFEKDLPISDCLADGHFVLTDSELVAVRNYYNQAKKCHQDECKQR